MRVGGLAWLLIFVTVPPPLTPTVDYTGYGRVNDSE